MINNVVLQGRLTKDPEVKKTESGVPRLIFTLAWNEKYKEVEKNCFMLCRAWRHNAEFIGKYFSKGSEIIVTGQLLTEKWNDSETTLLSVDNAHFCGSKHKKPDPMPEVEFVPVPDDADELPFK